MSWLRKMVSKIGKQNPEQSVDEGLDSIPTAHSMSAESAAPGAPSTAEDEENPTRQRRYFVKTGLYVDNEAEMAPANASEAVEEIPDRHPTDLKTLFPKLSLR
jgi:hypothetical protein